MIGRGSRIQRLEDGNAGDVAPVGDGVSEMRIHFGPGYRDYYVDRGGELILLLCGGDKGSQQRDIEAAKKLAREEDWAMPKTRVFDAAKYLDSPEMIAEYLTEAFETDDEVFIAKAIGIVARA
jgi:putative addiction module killer protein